MYNLTSPTINKHSLVYTISITKIQISIRNIIITHIHIIYIEHFTNFKNHDVMDKFHLKSSFIILLLLSRDIASNPGPVKFPCGICNEPMRKNKRGIQCEDCIMWHHIKCINLPVNKYNKLSTSTDSWFCKSCTLPNFIDSIFENTEKSNTPLLDYLPLSE